ncbi:phage tail protein [Brumimicrobium aurantiacum]|uniref:Uncharacterized protein n=1 Tax=Brumimicrobium aurantiacum TaxID=1737063 RepID=A0A3E1F237_9FLAO|nr:hypothetical protein [Brumimicrobium aurantiacum]RFC55767.1 hypothetical protein DXU93_02190 [Brumimicrobium aurantiacum]
MKKILLTSVLLLLIVFQGKTQRFDYENTSKMFLGLNIGSVWHTSDVQNVKNRFPLGAGFVIGGSINQNYGNAVSFDLRFRYLGGVWYGQDTDTTGAISNNYAVNQYYDTLGYTVQNFRNAQHRFALELSMHANRFKERTGIDPYIFGGIGFTASSLRGDLLDDVPGTSQGDIYAYDQTPNGSLIEKEYETPLDLNQNGDPYPSNEFDVKVLPSLGVGLGYYFNSRFSMGIEHKTTFFMDDYFDGTTFDQDGATSSFLDNDMYHYTSIYFKWYLKGKSSNDKWEEPVEDDPYTPAPVNKDQPIVDFTNPSNSPHRTNSRLFNLRANVYNVASASDITFTNNQQTNTNFVFNPSTNQFEATVQLVPGTNTFFLKGTNQFGKDRDVVEIYYVEEIERGNPPIVNITNPTALPYRTSSSTHTVVATIQNVQSSGWLEVWFNDMVVSNYNFSSYGTNNFSIPLNLIEGTNKLKIEGRNEFGQDMDEAIIIYKPIVNTDDREPPVVNILTPSSNPHITAQLNENIVAKVENVDLKQNIEVRVNGNIYSNFTFNAATGRVQFSTGINAGTNTVKISATNAVGSDFDETQIIYRRPTPVTPPNVNILTPNVSPYTVTQQTQGVIAEVENITSTSQIEVRINGVQTSNYSFNNTTKRIQFTAPLNAGVNTVNITVINNDGSDFDETQIIYREPIPVTPPTVNILTPNVSPYTVTQQTQGVIAEVENITSTSQIEVRINGVQTSNYSFNNTTKRIQFTAPLNTGVNTVNITVTNNDGSDFDETQIIYKEPVPVTPPTVNILTPNVSPYTVTQQTQGVIAEVENITSTSQIEVRINGAQTSNYSFNNTTKRIQFTAPLNAGVNTVNITVTNNDGSDFDETQIIYKEPVPVTPPTVNIISPNVSPYTATQQTQTIIAEVEHISSSTQIEVLFNGVQTNNFTFNSSTQQVQLVASLNLGSNTVKITATNNDGSDFDEAQLILNTNPDIGLPPVVTFITPDVNPYVTFQFSESIKAQVDHVSSAQEIDVEINGSSTNNFTFNNTTKEVQFSASLNTGMNTVKVTGTNMYGVNFEEATIVYKEQNVPQPPTIQFLAPVQNQGSVTQESYNMMAKVFNVTQGSDIQVYFNGSLVSANNYNFSPQSKLITFPSTLIIGVNTFKIKAQNNDGNAEETAQITRIGEGPGKDEGGNTGIKPTPCEKPKASFTSPRTTTSNVDEESYNVVAFLSNITSNNQIKVTLNGKTIKGFTFNSKTKLFKHTIKLTEGKNTYKLHITNSCGTIVKTYQFNYKPEPECGVVVEIINSSSEFCLTTSNGTVTTLDLMRNAKFIYAGQASAIYFKAQSTGYLMVNGKPYKIYQGNYYYFKGLMTVDFSRNRKDMPGQWSICISTNTTPNYGTGLRKPKNPCNTIKNTTPDSSPNIETKPDIQNKPTREINIQESPKPKIENTEGEIKQSSPQIQSKPNLRIP